LRIALIMVVLAIVMVVFVLRFRGTRQVMSSAFQPLGNTASEEQGDEAILRGLREHGSDLTKATDIINYLYIPSLADAQNIAEHLTRGGYQVELREPLGRLPNGEVESRYSVLIHVTDVPSIASIKKMRELMDSLAHRFHGEYDGWEAQVQP